MIRLPDDTINDLPYDRPYSKAEALLQVYYDREHNNTFTLRGYARQFTWSVHKVSDLLNRIKGTHKPSKNGTSKVKTKQFKPPTKEEINFYLLHLSEKYPEYKQFDIDKFINFYKSKGWFVGKNKMADWQSAVHGAKKWCIEIDDSITDRADALLKELKSDINYVTDPSNERLRAMVNKCKINQSIKDYALTKLGMKNE